MTAMTMKEATARARARYTCPETALQELDAIEAPLHRLMRAYDMVRIARNPQSRFGLDREDTAEVAAALGLLIEDLEAELDPLINWIAELDRQGMASDETRTYALVDFSELAQGIETVPLGRLGWGLGYNRR